MVQSATETGVSDWAWLKWLSAFSVVAAIFVNGVWSQRLNFWFQGDFHAFYCGAVVARSGHSPYLALPLAACERQLMPHTAAHAPAFLIPSPLSGYFLWLLTPLSMLSPIVASMAWTVLLVAAFFTLVWTLKSLTGIRVVYITMAAAVLGFWMPIVLGQPTSIAVALISLGALALRAGHFSLAAGLIALSTIEPHFGVPAAVATFVAVPKTRASLCIGAGILACASLAMLGVPENIEYFRSTLPDAIRDQVAFDDQYSFSYLLAIAHVPTEAAILGGKMSYGLFVVVGVVLASRLQARFNDPAVVPLVASACAVVGGPYLHVEHLLAAVPALLFLASRASQRRRWAAIAALVLVTLPAKIIALYLGAVPPIVITAYQISSVHAETRSESVWQTEIGSQSGHVVPFLVKIPAWLGLAIMVWGTASLLRRTPKAVTFGIDPLISDGRESSQATRRGLRSRTTP